MGTAELSPVELPTGPAGVWLLVLSVSSVPPTLALWGEGLLQKKTPSIL